MQHLDSEPIEQAWTMLIVKLIRNMGKSNLNRRHNTTV